MEGLSASYEKQPGLITVRDDDLCWTPTSPAASAKSIKINIPSITKTQQTPATAKKAVIKLFKEDGQYSFTFANREDMDFIVNTIKRITTTSKEAAASPATGGGTSATGESTRRTSTPTASAAKSVASTAKASLPATVPPASTISDADLMGDMELQRDLLESDAALKARFQLGLTNKPADVTFAQYTTTFWSARLHSLRMHAFAKSQQSAEYHVLSALQSTIQGNNSDDEMRMFNLTAGQIKMLLRQYPVLSAAYSENVPPLKTKDFWLRFLQSKLFKVLIGAEDGDVQKCKPDGIFDRYLSWTESEASNPDQHVPHYMDLQGNEQNRSLKGNQPDVTMRGKKTPFLQALNGVSGRMISHVTTQDGEAHAPIGLDEDTFEQVRLRDLANQDPDNRVRLNVSEHQIHLAGSRDSSSQAEKFAKQNPEEVLSLLRAEVRPFTLREIIGDSDDSSEGEDVSPNNKRKAHQASTASIMAKIRQQRRKAVLDAKEGRR